MRKKKKTWHNSAQMRNEIYQCSEKQKTQTIALNDSEYLFKLFLKMKDAVENRKEFAISGCFLFFHPGHWDDSLKLQKT